MRKLIVAALTLFSCRVMAVAAPTAGASDDDCQKEGTTCNMHWTDDPPPGD